MKSKRVILIGECDLRKRGHAGIEASLGRYHLTTGEVVRFDWVRTDAISTKTLPTIFAEATGVWCVPGSPYASTEGALLAIRHARECGLPFLGTCGGFQHALIEYCETVLKIPAAHQETEPDAKGPLIAKLSCSLIEARASVHAVPGSVYETVMGGIDFVEEFHCSYGVDPAFEPLFAKSEIEFVARDDARQVRVFWHREHPFFVGSLFQPERLALQGKLHPLVREFLTRT